MEGHLTKGNGGVPLITTPSAKRTRDGFVFSLAFFAALSSADLRAELSNGGWQTDRLTVSLQARTS